MWTASSGKHPFKKLESLHDHLNLQNESTQAEQLSTSRTDPSVVELFNQQHDTNTIISKFSEL